MTPAPRASALTEAPRAPADSVTLAHAERHRRRGLLVTDGGAEIMLDLAKATELMAGHALVLDDGREVLIRAAAEPLAEVRPGDAPLARLAWHVGNRHVPCQIEADRLLIARDHVLEAMLGGLGARIAHVEAPFHPEGGAYGHGRTHDHHH